MSAERGDDRVDEEVLKRILEEFLLQVGIREKETPLDYFDAAKLRGHDTWNRRWPALQRCKDELCQKQQVGRQNWPELQSFLERIQKTAAADAAAGDASEDEHSETRPVASSPTEMPIPTDVPEPTSPVQTEISASIEVRLDADDMAPASPRSSDAVPFSPRADALVESKDIISNICSWSDALEKKKRPPGSTGEDVVTPMPTWVSKALHDLFLLLREGVNQPVVGALRQPNQCGGCQRKRSRNQYLPFLQLLDARGMRTKAPAWTR